MSLYRRICGVFAMLLLLVLLTACGGSNTPQAQTKPTPVPPTPTPGPGQRLLTTMASKINTAKTLHGVFNVKITGTAINGIVDSEIWNVSPGKNRTVVLQSTISQFATGSVTVTDGKVLWQYDPAKKVVYKGEETATRGTGTPVAGATPDAGGGANQQFILTLVQSVFTHSDATLVSSSVKVGGHDAYDVHVVPQGQTSTAGGASGAANFNYDGDVFIDKTTNLPLRVNLTIQGLGQVLLDLPMLVVDQPIAESTFTFVVPAGVKVLPLSSSNGTPDTGSITLDQAQQQAGYHLLSIPNSQTAYVLGSVNALGAPGSQIFTLNYTRGGTSFTIAEGKSLANLPANSGGQQVSLRGTTSTVSTTNGAITLAWTENGVGISITGSGLSSDQIVAIAKLLS